MRTFLAAKLHRLHVTGADLHYVGSVTIDRALLDAVGIEPYEQVHVVNLANGERWITYAVPGDQPGQFEVNGGGARLAQVGDPCVIMTFVQADVFAPAAVAMFDPDNSITRATVYPAAAA